MIFLPAHKHTAGKMSINRSKIILSNLIKSPNCGKTEKTLGNAMIHSWSGDDSYLAKYFKPFPFIRISTTSHTPVFLFHLFLLLSVLSLAAPALVFWLSKHL